MGDVDLISLLGGEDFSRRIYQQADVADPAADMLFDLWQCSQIKIAGQRLQDRTYAVESEYPTNDLLKLRGHGLIEGDRSNLRFTDRAARVIRTMVLGESNHFRKGQVKKPYSLILATSKPSMLTRGAKVAEALEKESEDQWWRTQPIVRTYEYESDSTPGKYYQTPLYDNGLATCNCRGWRTNRTCWHTKEVEAKDEARQIRNPKPVAKATPNRAPRPVVAPKAAPVIPKSAPARVGDPKPTQPAQKLNPATFASDWKRFGLPEGYSLATPHLTTGDVKIEDPKGAVWTYIGSPAEVSSEIWTLWIRRKLGNDDWTLTALPIGRFVATSKKTPEKLVFDTPQEAADALLPQDAKAKSKAKPADVPPKAPKKLVSPFEDYDLGEADKMLETLKNPSKPSGGSHLSQAAPRILKIADRDL